MTIRIRNTDVVSHTWSGQVIVASGFYDIPTAEVNGFADSGKVFTAVASGQAVISDGTTDFTDPTEGWKFLIGGLPTEVTTQLEKSDITLKMACGKVVSDASGLAKLDIKVQGTPGTEDGRFVQGGTAWFLNHHPDDRFKVLIIDVDNIMGYGAGFQVGSYCEMGANSGFYAEPSGMVSVKSMGFFGFIPSGLYMRMEAQCGDGTIDTLYMNVVWGVKV